MNNKNLGEVTKETRTLRTHLNGKVGTSGPANENGNIDGKYEVHLHISFKIVSKDTILKEIINGKEGKKLVIGEHYKKLSVCNPFHNESKKSPNKKRNFI